jgi:hypothetical protein
LEGARGVDYKVSDAFQCAVICAFDPSSYAELAQALGRGSRGYKQRVLGWLITKDHFDVEKPENILEFFKNKLIGEG